MQRFLLCAMLAVLMHAAAANPSADDAATRSALQTLGVRAKRALDTTGDPHTTADIAQWRAQLARLSAGANTDPSSALARKYRAVAHLVNELAFAVAHPTLAAARRPQAKPAPLDRENLSAERGTACANALGVSFALPVEIALADAGGSGADAWFRLEPAAAGHVQFTTDSSGADPALAVYRDCSAAPLAQNDDTRGLDAYVDVALADRAPVFVHVSNGGSGGRVKLLATNADATLSGKVTDARTGAPLQFAQIELFNPDGSFAFSYVYSDANGLWSTTTYPGQYYVHVAADQHVAALYPNAPCSLNYYQPPLTACDSANAVLVTATGGSTTANIDAALGVGQRIAGIVRGSRNDALPNAEILVLDASGTVLTVGFSDAFGRYLISAVPNGTYFLEAIGSYASLYGAQLYDHVACGGPVGMNCDVSLATPIAIADNDLVGANFDLPRAASIHGSVHGPTAYGAYVYVVAPSGQYVAAGFIDALGNYNVGPLAIGDYDVYAISDGFFPQLYPGVDCSPDCPSDLAAATAVSITQLGDSPQADFILHPAPAQTGHIQDAKTGLPLAGVYVSVSTQVPPTIYPSATFTNSDGDYSLPSPGVGEFYVWAQSIDHIDEVYPAIPCEQPNYGAVACDVSGAIRMHVTPSSTTLPAKDFALQPSSAIGGSVGVRATSGAATGAIVQVFDASGAALDAANVDGRGHYSITDLAPGTYYASAQGAYYINYSVQLWQGIDCPSGCDVTQGTPIPLAANSTTNGIDFSLLRYDAVVGQVLDYRNQPIAGVLVDLFDANSLAYVNTGATDAQGNYLVTATYGSSYFVATEAWGAYIDQIWSGVSCPLGPAYLQQCPFTGATALSLGLGATQPHVANFQLIAPDEVFKGNFE